MGGFIFHPVEGAKYRQDYEKLTAELNGYQEKGNWESAVRMLRTHVWDDIFFLMYFILGIHAVNHPWLVDRINEVQNKRHRTLDLWARFHFKSSILTLATTIQDVLRNPEARICIFSHTRDISKAFLRRIKQTFETNGLLYTAFSDIIPENPAKRAIKWTEDEGLVLNRKGSYLESTIEAWGLIDHMPTGKHFTRRIYDDPVSPDTTRTKMQRDKLEEAFDLSHGLADPKGSVCVIGTRYHYGDLYAKLIKSGEWEVRRYPGTLQGNYPAKPEDATDDFFPMGNDVPVLYSPKEMWQFFKDMGAAVFASQMLLDPIKADERGFDIGWMRYYHERPHTRNFIFVDPAGEKKADSAFTVMWVVGVDQRNYYYILDCVRDRLDLSQKQKNLFALVEKWRALRVFYEKYSMQGDIEYIEEKKKETGVHFSIEPVGGSSLSKDERILKLQPLFQEGRIVFPPAIWYNDRDGKRHNLVEDFITDEYIDYPLSKYKDMLDALARLRDEKVRISGPVYVNPEVQVNKRNPLKEWAEVNTNAWLNM